MRFIPKITTAAAAFVLATAMTAPSIHAAPVQNVAMTTSVRAVTMTATTLVVAPAQDAKIEITTNEGRRGAWYTQPVWIAIGIIALVLIIALIAMAGRGRNTTVIK